MTEEEAAFHAAAKNLPDPRPRPEGELKILEEVWRQPTGWRLPTAVNNNIVGSASVGAALLFFVLAGCLALLLRSQLATPLAEHRGPETHTQLFTLHGTGMLS